MVLAAAAGMIGACAKVAGIDDLEIGECKGGVCVSEGGIEGSSSADAADTSTDVPDALVPFDGSALPCKSAHGPTMVRVGTTANNF
jgi:hypothetical protein